MRVLRNAIRSCKRAPRLSEAVAVMDDKAASTIATPSLWGSWGSWGSEKGMGKTREMAGGGLFRAP